MAYRRGCAYLARHDGPKAVAEFQDALNRPGTFPLVWLGLARALALEAGVDVTADPIRARAAGGSDAVTKARETYEKFFALWKDADPDLPILRRAKAEYAVVGHRK